MNNTATASAANTGQVTDTGMITCVIPVLSIVKTPDSGTISAGATATFTIVVTNNGPGTAAGVTITDPLPAGGGVNWTTASLNCTVTGAVGAQTLTCNVGSLAQAASFTAVATAVTTAAACTVMNNTATATASNAAPVNDVGLITCQPPGLTIVKTPDGGTITAGATATFTIVVTNNGPGAANALTLSDPLPAGGGVTWTTATAGCTISGAVGAQVLNCNFGTAAAGFTTTVVVTAVTTLQTCTALALVAAPNNKMNNTATASASNAPSVSDVGDITCQIPVLSIVETPDAGTINSGQTATFTIVATNLGPGTATGVTITDPLPAGGGVNWTTVTPNCTVTGAVGSQSLTCTVGSLAQSATFTAVVTALTSVASCTAMNNTATVSATNAAPVSDQGLITCTVINPVLTIVKTPDGQSILPGATAVFTMVVTNVGQSTANAVTLNDPLPAGGGVNWTTTTPNCTVSGPIGTQVLACNFGALAPAASVTVVVSAATSVSACTQMNNTATA